MEIWGANPFVRAVVILPGNTNTVTGNRDKTTSENKNYHFKSFSFKLLAPPLVCLEVL